MKGRAGGPGGYLSLMNRRESNSTDLNVSSPTTMRISQPRFMLFHDKLESETDEEMDALFMPLSLSWMIHPQYEDVGFADVLSSMSSSRADLRDIQQDSTHIYMRVLSALRLIRRDREETLWREDGSATLNVASSILIHVQLPVMLDKISSCDQCIGILKA